MVIANLHHAAPRIPALLTILTEFGWRATVITPPLDDNALLVLGLPNRFTELVDIAVAPYRGDIFRVWRSGLNKVGFSKQVSYTEQIKDRLGARERSTVDALMRAYQAVFGIPDTEWPWHSSAFRTAADLLREQHFAIVLSSSPHPTVHRVAARLKDLYPIKWIADFRDPWSQSHNYSLPKFRQHLDRRMEVRTIRNADLITTVSSGFAEKLTQLHGDRVVVVRNGYQAMPDSSPLTLPERFTISYTGTIYAGKQDPTKILAALGGLVRSGKIARERIALNFYGRFDVSLRDAIADQDLVGVAVQQGNLPRAEIRRRQRSSHLLLLLQWEVQHEQGILPLKFYEYLDAGRPILATGGSDSNEISAILEQTHTGTTAVTVSDIEQALLRSYDIYLNPNKSDYEGDLKAIAEFSYVGCAQQLAAHLDRIA